MENGRKSHGTDFPPHAIPEAVDFRNCALNILD